MIILFFIVTHWYLSLFFQTFFLHRYASHNMYRMSSMWEKLFYLLTFFFQGSSFLHPAAYALMHRRHHAYADTNRDPHSPIILEGLFSFNRRTFLEYRKIVNQFNHHQIFLKDVPRWPILEKIGEFYSIRLLFILFYIFIYYNYSPSIWYFLLIPVHIFMGAIHGFIVNWFGHLIGYRNFDDLKDNSKNTLPVDFLMMGELYQNNHHRYPKKGDFAHRWFEVDIGYMITIILLRFKIIQLSKDK